MLYPVSLKGTAMPITHHLAPDSLAASTAPLAAEDRSAYAAAMEQTEAVFALEGMEPSEQDRAITAAILAGRVSPEQAREELLAYVTAHKTVKGFLESREWAQ